MNELSEWMDRTVLMAHSISRGELLGQYCDDSAQAVFVYRGGVPVCHVISQGRRGLLNALVFTVLGLAADAAVGMFGDAVATTDRNPVSKHAWTPEELEVWWNRLQEIGESPCLTRVLGMIGAGPDGTVEERLWTLHERGDDLDWRSFDPGELPRLRSQNLADFTYGLLAGPLSGDDLSEGYRLPKRGSAGSESEHDEAWRDVEFFLTLDERIATKFAHWALCAEEGSLRHDILASALPDEQIQLY